MGTNSEEIPMYCIKADPALEGLNLQFYGSPGISSYSTPFITGMHPFSSFCHLSIVSVKFINSLEHSKVYIVYEN